MVDDVPARAGFKNWVTWIFLGTLGWIVGFFGTFGAIAVLGDAAYGDPDLAYGSDFSYAGTLTLAFAMGGLGLGMAQVVALRRPLRLGSGWSVAYVAGGVMLGLVAAALGGSENLAITLLPYVVGGLLVGLMQALQLRPVVPAAWAWFVVQSVAFVMAGALEVTLASALGINRSWTLAIGVAAANLLTGFVALLLARNRFGTVRPAPAAWIRAAASPAPVPSLRGQPPPR